MNHLALAAALFLCAAAPAAAFTAPLKNPQPQGGYGVITDYNGVPIPGAEAIRSDGYAVGADGRVIRDAAGAPIQARRSGGGYVEPVRAGAIVDETGFEIPDAVGINRAGYAIRADGSVILDVLGEPILARRDRRR